MRNFYLSCLLLITFTSLSLAQAQETNEMYRKYVSQEYDLLMRARDTTSRMAGATISAQLENLQITGDDPWNEITVPVVFHVLSSANSTPIEESDISEQLDILNEDFAAANVPSDDPRDPEGQIRQLATDTKIKFCQVAVNRVIVPNLTAAYAQRDSLTVAEATAIKQSLTGAAPWDTKRYLNVWIVELPEHVGGFAQLPGAPGITDGVVIGARYFGTGTSALPPYDGGKTLTHLMGTYLGLAELWDNSGCGDDGVEDTPVHNAPNFGVPTVEHISTCDGFPSEMTMNYMDNTDDEAQYMFTRGQALRMRSVLITGGLRSALITTTTDCTINAVASTVSAASHRNMSISQGMEETTVASAELGPNPTRDFAQLAIRLPQDNREADINIYDAKGSIIITQRVVADDAGHALTRLEVSNWATGTYLVRITFPKGQLTKRLTVG